MRFLLRVILPAAAVLAVIQFASVPGALASDVTVTSPDYAQLPPDKQKALIAELKKQGLLAEDDSVVNKSPPPPETRSLAAGLLLALAPAACRMIAETKKADELAACAALKTPEAQDGCKAKAEKAFGSIESVCSLIKLF